MPLDKIGYNISKKSAIGYLKNLVNLGNKLGVFIWLELPEKNVDLEDLPYGKGVGFAISMAALANGYAYKLAAENPAIKVMLSPNNAEVQGKKGTEKSKKESRKKEQEISRIVEELEQKVNQLVVQFPTESLISLFAKSGGHKKNLIFEFQLGYEKKHLAKMLKKNWRVSVYVPFGKGWADYAATKLQGHYTHLLVSRFLEGKKVE